MPEFTLDMPEKMYDYLMLSAIYYQKDPDELIYELLTAFFNNDRNDIEGLSYIIAGRGFKAWKNECKALKEQQHKVFDEEIDMYGLRGHKDKKEYKKERLKKYWNENQKTIKGDFYKTFTGFLRERHLRLPVIEDIIDKTKTMLLWEGRENL